MQDWSMLIQGLYVFSWIVFFISSCAIALGGYIEVKHGEDKGLYYAFAGFIGLALSGLIMTIACGIP